MHVMLPCLPSLSRFEFKEPWESGMGLNKLYVKKKNRQIRSHEVMYVYMYCANAW